MADTLDSVRDYSADQMGSDCRFEFVYDPAYRRDQDVDSALDNQGTDLCCQDA